MELKDKKCVPCEKNTNVPPLTRAQAEDFLQNIPGWELSTDAKQISKSWKFKDFHEALMFANRVGKLADEEWHHPDLAVGWGKVTVTLSTHSIGGLSENDIILAAKINSLD